MNIHKIAAMLRELADTYDTGSSNIVNTKVDLLREIADELDPPARPESPIDPVEIPLRMLILQAMEEGKNIRTYYQDMVFTPVALTDLLANGKFRWWNIANWEITDREQNYSPPITLTEPAPRPLLADAEVGWVCRHRNGKYSQIIEVNYPNYIPPPYYIKTNYNGGSMFTIDGKAADIIEHDIIHTEPLAPEGTAEWAGQMLKLGCPVKHDSFNDYQEKRGLDEVAFHTSTITSPIDSWIHNVPKTGWQLYEEPKPFANVKVGDWVTDGVVTGCVSELCGSECLGIDATDGSSYHINTTNARKLSPSEVVVHIGCLSGTVRPVSTNGIHIWFHLIDANDKTIATICISYLDIRTREIVESLLKAQEEANG